MKAHGELAVLAPAVIAAVLAALPIFAGPVWDWKLDQGCRLAVVNVSSGGRPGFTMPDAAVTGLAFTNVLREERGLTNHILMSGSGVACGDVDADGWCDVYLCGLDSPNKLFRNLGGWRFTDITAAAGVACENQDSTGAAFADVDGDGDLDLVVNGLGHGTRLFQNDGRGRFRETTHEAGLASRSAAMSMALADIDGDGDLDLYVANFRTSTVHDQPALRFRVGVVNGERTVTMIEGRPPTAEERTRFSVNPIGDTIIENGEADVLYHNDGRGRFIPASWTDGSFLDLDGQPLAAPPYDWGYSAMFRDMNGDGAPDLYVCNDNESPDRCWINDGSGRFRAIARLALRRSSLSSMGVDFADVNRDGFDDFFVADMLARERGLRHRLMADLIPPGPPGLWSDRPAYGRNTLFIGRGDGSWAEVAQLAGLEASDWSWCPAFLDVDLDGYEDLIVTTGLERSLRDADARRRIDALKAQQKLTAHEFQELRRSMPRLESPVCAFRNRGDLTFEPASDAWGFRAGLVAQGLALADLDNDGDLDAVINVMNGPALLCRNETSAPRLAVRLKGMGANTRGIGAKLRVLGGPVPQSQEMICGGRYLSGDDTLRVFAVGQATNGLTVEVTWRNGRQSVVSNVPPNRVCEVGEDGAVAVARSQPAAQKPFFKDASDLLKHVHHEEAFDDLQPLLPRRLSQFGPSVCWADYDGDGWDDLFVGSGRGGEIALFINDGRGGFETVPLTDVPGRLPVDSAAILNLPTASGSMLLVGVQNYEAGPIRLPSVVRVEMRSDAMRAAGALPGQASCTGPMAAADVDGDGQLDLFVGGRFVPGRYPEPATARLFRGSDGDLRLDESARSIFDKAGLVSGATFSDLDGDGFPELVLACEWGSLKVFRNQRGRFVAWNAPVTLSSSQPSTLDQITGWWTSVTAGDFDGDGQLDLAAGNWGRNSKYQPRVGKPVRMFYGDSRGDDSLLVVEAFEEARGRLVPRRHRDLLALTVPWVREKFTTHAAYSAASLDEILGEHRAAMMEVSAATLDSMVFLNRGDHFEAKALPLEAQLAPVFGLSVGDFDGDGSEDLFLAQNFFGVDPETSRHDAGRGLWLRGDGHGTFTAVPVSESGVMVAGEGRGAALSDWDGDGRVDLAVAQNGAVTKLYHNERAKPGLRVRLKGTDGNRVGIGAALRAGAEGKLGPPHEIRAGSGYWSQDSAVPVLCGTAPLTKLEVRWPGGAKTSTDLPAGAREVTVDGTGKIIQKR